MRQAERSLLFPGASHRVISPGILAGHPSSSLLASPLLCSAEPPNVYDVFQQIDRRLGITFKNIYNASR